MTRPYNRKVPLPSPEERFYQRIVMGSGGCHIWTGAIGATGYGMFAFSSDRKMMAHRAAWIFTYGEDALPPWPASGFVLDHTCNNKVCVNPEHLRLIKHEDNVRLKKKRGKSQRKYHCLCCPNHPSNHGRNQE